MSITIDKYRNIADSPCLLCVNLLDIAERTCKAFPVVIPDVIYLGEHDHRKPFGDEAERDGKPILFEPVTP